MMQIGLPGALITPSESFGVYGAKAGGCPVLPTATLDIPLDAVNCGVCANPLALVLQTHAPLKRDLSEGEVLERWLYLFGCVQKGCGQGSKCWKLLRLQTQPQSPAPLHSAATSGTESTDAPDLCEGEATEGFSLEGLKQALATTASRAKKKKKAQKPDPTAVGVGEGYGVKTAWSPLLPEFRIYTEYERTNKGRSVDAPHIQASLERYQETEAAAESSDWIGEVYEKSAVETGDGGAFWKFQKRLQDCPKQCVRYGFNGALLNPVHSSISPPLCSHCGSKRVFELQLMPHLINAFYEAALWIQNDDSIEKRPEIVEALRNADSCSMEWDWSSIAVYTCHQSCFNRQWTEEHVILL